MNWFLIALLGPLLWSVSNHLDKFVLNRYFQKFGIGAIAILVALVDACFAPIVFLFNPQIFTPPSLHIFLLVIFGAINILNLIVYFYALNGEDTSIVVPLFQLVPVLTYILGYFFLHETLSSRQILASAMKLHGLTLVVSYDTASPSILFELVSFAS